MNSSPSEATMPDGNFEELRAALAEFSRAIREGSELQRRLRNALRTTLQRFIRLSKAHRERTRRAAHWPRDPHAFGKAVRYMRQVEKLTQRQLAELVGVGCHTICRIEAGAPCWPTTRDWIIEAFDRLEQKRAKHAGPSA